MRVVIALAGSVFLSACAGNLYTIEDPRPDASGRIAGILVYQPRTLILISEFTVASDSNGNVILSSNGLPAPCTPVRSYELTTVTDYSRRYAIGYKAGLFESKKLSMDLEKGVLAKINSESTAGIKEVTELLSALLGTAKNALLPGGPATGQASPLCNNGKRLVGFMTLEDLCHQTRTNSCP